MKKIKKLFEEINMSWIKVIIFAILAGIYTAVVNLIPVFKDTSLSDIAVNLECWILFAIIIIMNCKKPLEASIKCFVFFLISQPLVYLIESLFIGFDVFQYYKIWFVWTVLTLPGSFIAWYIKKQNLLSTCILSVATGMLSLLGTTYLFIVINNFPRHVLSMIFCIILAFLLPIILLKEKKQKIIAIVISIVMIFVGIIFNNRTNDSYIETIDYKLDDGINWEFRIDDEKNFEINQYDENSVIITIKGKSDKETKLYCINSNGEEKIVNIIMKNGLSSLMEN